MNADGIKAVAFDLGGTLLFSKTGNWYLTEPLMEILQAHNCGPEEISQAISSAKRATSTKVRADTVAQEKEIYQLFYRELLHHLGIVDCISATQLAVLSNARASAKDRYTVNWSAIEIIQAIQAHISTVLFSNTWPSVIAFLREEGVLDAFSYTFFSCYTGYKKPDPRSFELLQVTTHCIPTEILLYDDNPTVVEAAAFRGIHARLITYETLTSAILEDFFGE